VSKLLPKKGEFIVAKETSGGNYITKGKVYEVARDVTEHTTGYSDTVVEIKQNDLGTPIAVYLRRFEPLQLTPPVAPQKPFPLPAAEVSQGRHFEVRSASTQLSAPKAITRTSYLSKAEEFVLKNAGNYNGDFEIVEVQIIQRTTVLRKVKREAVTTYKLVDA
jgi:hypothetical protein